MNLQKKKKEGKERNLGLTRYDSPGPRATRKIPPYAVTASVPFPLTLITNGETSKLLKLS